MAQHDYVIANGSGSAVRGDLNSALAAIVTNNSDTSEPSTTYPYQWWADTTTGLLKIRNGGNSAWITLRELDGTLVIEAGTVTAPGLYFVGDTNTGIYSPAADQFAITTNGVERVEWGTSEVVFNDGGADYDFRVEGDTKANLFLVDAGTDSVSIDGTTLQLANQTPLRLGDADNSHYVALRSPATVGTNVTWDLPAADGTADQVLKTDGSGALGWATRVRMVLETAKTATGTDVDFTGIPSWAKKITVMFSGVSTNGSTGFRIQLGDAGGLETTGYLSSATVLGGTVITDSSTSSFVLVGNIGSGDVNQGSVVISNFAGTTWISTGVLARSASGTGVGTHTSAGSKTLSDTLTQLRVTIGGGQAFDAGTINILIEG